LIVRQVSQSQPSEGNENEFRTLAGTSHWSSFQDGV